MASIHQLAQISAGFLVGRLPEGKNKPEVEVVAFGLEVALGGIFQLLVFAVAAWYLEMVPEMGAALLTMATYRLVAGGAHCSAYHRCLLLSLVTLAMCAYTGRWLAAFSINIAFFIVLLTVLSLVTAYCWAPATTPAAPIINPKRRLVLKTACYIWLLVWSVLMFAGIYLNWPITVLGSSMAALVIQDINLTPAGYAFLGWVDNLMSRILPLGIKNE